MFKKLKQKIEEGVANSPVRAQVQQKFQQLMAKDDDQQESDEAGGDFLQAKPLNSLNSRRLDNPAQLSVSQTGTDLLATPTSNHDQSSVYSTPPEQMASISAFSISDDMPLTPTRSRTSSISSNASEAGLFSPVQFAVRQYVLPSDVESEVEDSSVVSLGAVTKEQLCQHFKKMQRRAEKYRAKFEQVMNAYKEIERERDKLKTNMTTSQDRAFRRISELKEQLHLDVLAKQDLEANYNLMLEEKDELVKVLQTQIGLLKEGKELPEDLLKKSVAAEATPTKATPSSPGAMDDEGTVNTLALKEKIRRLEVLLNKCKETIKNNKERMAQTNKERDNVQRQLDEREVDTGVLKDGFQKERSKLQSQITEARSIMEDLETDKVMQVAEAKQQMHVSMEAKDRELESIRAACAASQADKEALEVKVTRLEKGTAEQLEKSREVIRRLTEEKKKVTEEVKQALKQSEQALEAEREALMAELKRGKAAALTLMQQEMDKKIADVSQDRDTALQQRDAEWQVKMEAKEKECREKFAAQLEKEEEELAAKLKQNEDALKRSYTERESAMKWKMAEREEEMKLAIEERELQKMAALSHQDNQKDELTWELEEIKCEKSRLETTAENLKEAHMAQIKDFMNQIEENAKRNKDKFEQLTATHEEQLRQLKAENLQLTQERLDELQQQHQLQVDAVTKQYECSLSTSNSDINTMFTTQIETLKASHQKVAEEQNKQLETFRKQVSKLSENNVELRTEIVEAALQNAAQVTELEQRLDEQTDLTGKLMMGKENLEREKEMLEEKVKQILKQTDNLNSKLEHITSENSNLIQTIEQQRASIVEKDESLRMKDQQIFDHNQKWQNEKAQLNSDVEISKKELAQNIKQYEAQLKEERSSHEQELARRLEMDQMQQQSSTDKLAAQLNKQLSSANQKISSHEILIQELRMNESDLNNRIANSQQGYEERIATLLGDKASIEKKVEGLGDKLKKFKKDKQQLDDEYKAKCTSQTKSITELKDNVEQLTKGENDLREQLGATLRDCESKLSSVTDNYTTEVSRLSQTISQNQCQLESLMGELKATRTETAHISKKFNLEIDSRTAELDDAHEQIRCGQEEWEKTQQELEGRITEVTKDVQQRREELKVMQKELQEKCSHLNSSSQRVAELEQNLSTWQTAAKEKEGAQSDLLHRIAEMETTSQQQREALQEKVVFLEKQVHEKDSASADIYTRMSSLEKAICENEAVLAQRESQLKKAQDGHDSMLHTHSEALALVQKETDEKQEKIHQLEQQIIQIQKNGHEEQEASVAVIWSQVDKKNAELEAANKKFGQLREEAKCRIKDLKSRMEEAVSQLEDKDKQIEAKEVEMKMRMQSMLEEFEHEKADLNLDKQASIKVLTEKLEQERESLTGFKESVEKQYRERQEQVKETMTSMKERFEEMLKEKEDIFNKRVKKAETAMEREKMQALTERENKFQEQIEEFKMKYSENYKAAIAELEDRHIVVLEVIRAELELTHSKIQELTIERDTLLRESASFKSETEQQIIELTASIQELQLQNESLSKNAEEAQSLRRKNVELECVYEKYESELQEKTVKEQQLVEQVQAVTRKSLSLDEEVKKLSEQIEMSQKGSDSLEEECQDRIKLLQEQYQSQVQNKQAELEERINAVKISYEEEIEKMKMEHNNKLEEQVMMLEENNSKLKEHAALVERKREEIKELREKFKQLREKVVTKVEEMQTQLDTKDKALVAAGELAEATRVEYEARLAEMTENDMELQAKFKELTLKLNSTEEQLKEYTHILESTIEGYKKELSEQKSHYEGQISFLTQQVTEFRDQSRMTAEGLQKELQAKVAEKNEQLRVQEERHADEIAKLKEVMKIKLQELKQQYAIKVKDAMKQGESKVKEIEDSLQEVSNDKKNALHKINILQEMIIFKQTCISEFETKLKVTEEEMNEKLNMQEAELKILRNEVEIEKQMRGKTAEQLKEQLSVQHDKLKAEYESSLKVQTLAVNSKLAELDEQKQQQLRALREDFNQQIKHKQIAFEEQRTVEIKELEERTSEKLKVKDEECQAKLVELKKKAENKFLQIKKTLAGNQETAIADLSKSNSILQDNVNQLETQIARIEQEKTELETRHSQQQEELDKIRATFDEEIQSKCSVIVEGVQKSESIQELEEKLNVLATDLNKGKEDMNDKSTAMAKEKDDCQTENDKLKKDKCDLQSRIEKCEEHTKKINSEMERLKHSHDVDVRVMKLEHEEEMEKMKTEFEGRIEDIEADHNVRVKQLVKEFQLKVAEKERDFQNTFSSVVEKGQREEDKAAYEHRQEMEELLQDLHEKDQKMEELIDDQEVQMQAKDEMLKAAVAEQDAQVSGVQQEMAGLREAVSAERQAMEVDVRAQLTRQFEGRQRQHQEEVEGLTKEWQLERQSTASTSDEYQTQELVQQNQLTLNAIQSSSSSSELLRHHVIGLTKQLEELKVRHKLELAEVRSGRDMQKSGLPKPLLGASDTQGLEEGSELQQLELHNVDLQTHLLQQSADVARLKVTERDLKHLVESLQKKMYALEHGEPPPGSPYNNTTGLPAGPLLTEPTEMEYLRNILYEYMMGKETKTLARVIATVLRFSDEQTRRIIEQEDSRNASFTYRAWMSPVDM